MQRTHDPGCASKGYTVFFVTGRPESQRAGTEASLAKGRVRR